jgi:hypothetical protein
VGVLYVWVMNVAHLRIQVAVITVQNILVNHNNHLNPNNQPVKRTSSSSSDVTSQRTGHPCNRDTGSGIHIMAVAWTAGYKYVTRMFQT